MNTHAHTRAARHGCITRAKRKQSGSSPSPTSSPHDNLIFWARDHRLATYYPWAFASDSNGVGAQDVKTQAWKKKQSEKNGISSCVFHCSPSCFRNLFFFLVWHYGSATHSAAVIQNRHSHMNYRFSHRLAATSNLKALISSQFTPLGGKKAAVLLHWYDSALLWLTSLTPINLWVCVCVTDNEQGVYKCVYERERGLS